MSFPRYPSYKDSGVEWLGEVPVHWEVKPVRNLASIVNGYPFDSALFDVAEGSPLIRIRDLNKIEAETFYKGEFVENAAITSDDVLIGMDGDFNVGRWRGAGRALLNQRMCCVRGKSNILTRLLEYALPIRLKAINDVTYATTVKHLASSQVEKTFVTIPPDTAEQTQIAAFLDRETAKIDELVAEQRRLMELLKEKRQAVISHAVTQGLNPHAPMKPSGIEWLGDVPAGWSVRPLKHLARLQTGMTPPTDDLDNYTEDEMFQWIRPEDLNETGAPTKASKFLTEKGWALTRQIAAGSTLICCIGTIGKVGITNDVAATNQQITAAVPLDDRRYLFYAISAGRTELELASTGNVLRILNTERLGNIHFPSPPLCEQIAIAEFLDSQLAKFNTLTAEAQRAIDLLQERRTALISAAVTGQIDVRQLAEMEPA